MYTSHAPPAPAPNPNAGRSPNYPNTWKLLTDNNTAKCRICERKLRQIKWSVKCDKCGKLICPDCWQGTRELVGEIHLEGYWQNLDGCWCRHPTGVDSARLPEINARNARILAAQTPKKRKVDNDVQDSPSSARPTKKTTDTHPVEDDEDPQQTAEDADNDRLFVRQTPAQTYGAQRSAAPSFSMMGRPRGTEWAQEEPDQIDDDDEDEDEITVAPPRPKLEPWREQTKAGKKSMSRPGAVEHLDGKTTVVVGCGIIGMSIALELAKHAHKTGTRHKVIIVELHDEYAPLASEQCAGVISRYGLPAVYNKLYDVSAQCWADTFASPTMVTRFRQQSDAIGIAKTPDHASEASADAPSWYVPKTGETLQPLGSEVGRISTRRYNKWLYEQCIAYNVDFAWELLPHSIERPGATGEISQLRLAKVNNPSVALDSDAIDCQNIVVAAGAWTTQVCQDMISWTPVADTVNYQQPVNWLRIPYDDFSEGEEPRTVIVQDESDAEMSPIISSHPRRKTIVISALEDGNREGRLPIPKALSNADTPRTHNLRELAAERINNYSDAKIFKGRSMVSSGPDFRAVIDKVPTTTIDRLSLNREWNEPHLGVWLAYGFGMHGTTLAPGVAKVIQRRICGEESGIIDSVFAIPKENLWEPLEPYGSVRQTTEMANR